MLSCGARCQLLLSQAELWLVHGIPWLGASAGVLTELFLRIQGLLLAEVLRLRVGWLVEWVLVALQQLWPLELASGLPSHLALATLVVLPYVCHVHHQHKHGPLQLEVQGGKLAEQGVQLQRLGWQVAYASTPVCYVQGVGWLLMFWLLYTQCDTLKLSWWEALEDSLCSLLLTAGSMQLATSTCHS